MTDPLVVGLKFCVKQPLCIPQNQAQEMLQFPGSLAGRHGAEVKKDTEGETGSVRTKEIKGKCVKKSEREKKKD